MDEGFVYSLPSGWEKIKVGEEPRYGRLLYREGPKKGKPRADGMLYDRLNPLTPVSPTNVKKEMDVVVSATGKVTTVKRLIHFDPRPGHGVHADVGN